MSVHPPRVPPDQRNPHKQPESQRSSGSRIEQDNRRNRNLKEQGRQGNVKQNTTNPGYQQDR